MGKTKKYTLYVYIYIYDVLRDLVSAIFLPFV